MLTSTNKVEIMHWEMPREALANLVALAEKIGESNAGRAYFFPSGAKIFEQIQNTGQRIALGRNIPAQVGGQMTLETPPTATEAFQYGLFVQLTKMSGKELGLRWDSTLVLPQAETPAEAASPEPAARATAEANLSGSATLSTAGLLLIVMDPSNRSPREEFLVRAGDGPWTIFASQEFRVGMTDWVISVQVK